ncbi:hypothetical protein HMPREF9372_0511 [Sporosarcina newyorkensis 2681]|uniref:Uncharacterized protein n=1 Tax=Sporosarcina newyorkensis 2681 TaxID=1027292 RepID=F9DNY1_9BACL|nr:hypothetical protein HMPREF9372_0511 [Sporosarcina newyorkensis 2681]
MKDRSRAYTRHQRERIIKKKVSILRDILGYEERHLPIRGTLSKGKVHCSCKLCRYEQVYGIPKAKHRVIWEAMEKEMDI